MSESSFGLKAKLVTLIECYETAMGAPRKGAIRDVLTDLVHIMHDHGLDAEERFQAALDVAAEEDVAASLEKFDREGKEKS